MNRGRQTNEAQVSLHMYLENACTYLHKEKIELDRVVAIHILVREKELLSESQHGRLFDPLLSETLVWVQPVHCMWGKGRIHLRCVLHKIIMGCGSEQVSQSNIAWHAWSTLVLIMQWPNIGQFCLRVIG